MYLNKGNTREAMKTLKRLLITFDVFKLGSVRAGVGGIACLLITFDVFK